MLHTQAVKVIKNHSSETLFQVHFLTFLDETLFLSDLQLSYHRWLSNLQTRKFRKQEGILLKHGPTFQNAETLSLPC